MDSELLAPALVPLGLPRAQAGWEIVAFYPLFPTGLPIALFDAKPMSALAYAGFPVFAATAIAYRCAKRPGVKLLVLIVQFALLLLTINGCRSIFSAIPH